jgi:hypothetical protein
MSAAIRAAGFVARRTPSRRRRHIGNPDVVLAAIRAWNEGYGSPPTMTDWAPGRARRLGQAWRIARYYENDWPSLATVRYHFKTLNLAVTAGAATPYDRTRRVAWRIQRTARRVAGRASAARAPEAAAC